MLGASVLACGQAWAAFGDTDTTFGSTAVPGFAIHNLGGSGDSALDTVTGANDQLYSLGITCEPGTCQASNKLVVTRYTADGHLDTTFGNGGDLVVDNNIPTFDYRLEVDDKNSQVYVSTVICDGTACGVFVARRNFNGTLDTTYGTNGTASFTTAINRPAVLQLLLQNNGKLLLLIEHDTVDNSEATTATRINIVRLNRDGTPDTSWGGDGSIDVSTPGGCDQGPNMMLGRDPVLYVTAAKASTCAGPYTPVVRRFNSVGNKDTTFGTNGEVASNFGFASDVVALVAQEQSDGKIGYGIGAFTSSGLAIDMLKLQNDGTQDTSFTPQHGSWTPIQGFTPSGNAPFQTDGKLIFAGRYQATGSSNSDEALTRLQGSSLFAHPPRFGAGFGEPFVGFLTASTTVPESAGTITVTLSMTEATDHDVTVPFTLGGSATRGVDYNVSSDAFVIPAGATSATVAVSIADDNVVKFGESILFDLGTPDGALSTTNHNTFIVDIEDNDLVTKPVVVPDAGGALPLELLIGLFGLAGLRRAALRRR